MLAAGCAAKQPRGRVSISRDFISVGRGLFYFYSAQREINGKHPRRRISEEKNEVYLLFENSFFNVYFFSLTPSKAGKNNATLNQIKSCSPNWMIYLIGGVESGGC